MAITRTARHPRSARTADTATSRRRLHDPTIPDLGLAFRSCRVADLPIVPKSVRRSRREGPIVRRAAGAGLRPRSLASPDLEAGGRFPGMTVTTIQAVANPTIAIAGLLLAAWTLWFNSRNSSREAHLARIWAKRADTYAELLTDLTRADVQEFSAPGSTSWESHFTSPLHGRVLAFASEDVRKAYIAFATAQIEASRKQTLSTLQSAMLVDLQRAPWERRSQEPGRRGAFVVHKCLDNPMIGSADMPMSASSVQPKSR